MVRMTSSVSVSLRLRGRGRRHAGGRLQHLEGLHAGLAQRSLAARGLLARERLRALAAEAPERLDRGELERMQAALAEHAALAQHALERREAVGMTVAAERER